MVQLRNRNSINLQIFHLYMACLLQPECHFLHGFFRCSLPVEVMDIEVKITSMQGTHILRRDRTTQLIKCTPWSASLHLHPTIIKKMKTFLQVEGKMGLIPVQVPANQFRPPLPETNPNVRRSDVAEKRKRAAPKKKFRPNLLQHTFPYQWPHQSFRIVHPYHLTPTICSSKRRHPMSCTCEMLGNLFEDWLLAKTIWPLKAKVKT